MVNESHKTVSAVYAFYLDETLKEPKDPANVGV
jgi:hypothetical protein